jgi:hypothetical protein
MAKSESAFAQIKADIKLGECPEASVDIAFTAGRACAVAFGYAVNLSLFFVACV